MSIGWSNWATTTSPNEPIHMAVALDQLLAGEEVEPSEIATVGCTSKYRNAQERVARFGYDPMAD